MLNIVVPYFNPFNNPLRKKNTLAFLNYLNAHLGVRVILVEAITFGQHPLENTAKDAHIIVYPETLIWRKENLINIAVEQLPDDARFAWIDSDITFAYPDWVQVIQRGLNTNDVVQVFNKAEFLGEREETLRTDVGVVRENQGVLSLRNGSGDGILKGHPGYGWAMTKSAWKKIHGLPVFSLVGSGDVEFAYSVLGSVQRLYKEKTEDHYHCLYGWSLEASNLKVDYCNMRLFHHWHGPLEGRKYFKRDEILVKHNYNPVLDMRWTEDGLLELSDHGMRMQPDLEEFFRNYS